MSNLIKPYEISVWDDVWNSTEGKFEEKRLGIIGTHTMDALTRALEPNLTRNVNGTKKLTFKMYKYYKDTITGEQMENPFVDWFVSERKVKLKYGTYIDSDGTEKDRWYDFIIKNINENSSNYQYTYQLEDALVQELSKNGFATTLDQQLMNNTGTAKELSEKVLEDTDWTVESETFVQTVDENLIYVYMPAGTYYRVEDQNAQNRVLGVAENQTNLTAGTALAFYSSCKNKPHRFQFIRLGTSGSDYNKGKITRDDKRFIDIDKHPDCQYFIDITNPETGYTEKEGYFLPSGWSIATQSQRGYDGDLKAYDTVLSNWYRGKRYGYSQVTKYIPAVDKYCKLYKIGGVNYYGFVENEYTSPALIKNVITNPEFSSTTGWTGTYYGSTGNIKNSVGAKVENVYGRFVGGKFSSVVDELANGTYDVDNEYTSYLKMTFPPRSGGNKGIVINSGFYDQRTTISSVGYDEQWYFDCEAISSSGAALSPHLLNSKFSFKLREVDYNTTLGNYTLGDVWAQGIPSNNLLVFNSSSRKTDGYADVNISAEDFKKKNIRLVLELNSHSESTEEVVYLKKMELFKRVLNAQNQVIRPGELEKEGIVKTYYKFFPESQKDLTNAEEMIFNTTTTLNYGTYVPVYVEGAEKVRSITAKESNYFNILQSIAETFECWVDLKITRDSLGGVTGKKISLKNYIGKDNFASFRYGVNLKDIQRTFESKNIVTKLLVKQNSNEHAENGFCTIARAGSNPTGENYIYDFQYFHGRDILDIDEYNASMYYATNPLNSSITQSGLDVGGGTYNVQNYVNRVKAINEKIKPINEDIIDLSADLTKLTAELKVQEGLRDAARSSLEEVTGEFLSLTGLMPDQISAGDFTKITCAIPAASHIESGANKLNSAAWATDATVSATQQGAANSTTWEFNIALADTPKEISKKTPRANSGAEWSGNRLTCDGKWEGLEIEPEEGFQANGRYVLEYTLQKASTNGGVLENIGSHVASFRNVELWVDGVKADENPVNITDDTNEHTIKLVGTFYNTSDLTPYMYIQPNRGSTTAVSCVIKDIKLSKYSLNTSSKERTFKIKPTFTLTPTSGAAVTRTPIISCTIPADSHTGTHTYSLAIVDTTASSVAGLLQEYAEYGRNYREASAQVGSEDVANSGLAYSVKAKKAEIEAKDALRKTYLDQKAALNKCFYEKYSRFIQEGTWISEEYIDDDKYYADALSVLYNSCYPQVTYSINVISLKGLPGYEHFDFEIGDKTFAVDPEFFGEKLKEEVVIAEMSEMLDDPSKNTIKVQNFKNQFQDLFQKITATVQQAQYSTGAYEKAAALAEADEKTKNQFVSEGLSAYASKLSVAGQTTVVQDESGITLTDSATQDQMRLIGGAILMSKQDPETGLRSWKTGLTPEGISASYVTAGVIDAGKIQIKNVNDPVFIWNAYGLSAFDADWYSNGSINKPNPYKFVRFDKYGIYGINTEKGTDDEINGVTWKPSSPDEVDERATFALTWDGLKVKNSGGVELRIGDGAKGARGDTDLLSVHNGTNRIFAITEDGSLLWDSSSTPTKVLYARTQLDTPTLKYSDYNDSNTFVEGQPTTNEWHKIKHETDWYASYSYDGGNIWTLPVLIQSAGVDRIEEKYFATDKAPSELTPTYENTWYPSPADAGHSAVNKYLWNYEITHYTNGTFVSSAPALIATQAKEIAEIVNFYYTTSATSSTPATPDDGYTLTINANGEVSLTPKWKTPSARVSWKQVGGGKTETIPNANPSQRLWNFEVICYSDGTYEAHSPANIGTGGDSPYQLSLTNDMDSIVFNNAGECITDLPIQISCVAYEGHTQVNDPDIQVTAVNPSNKWMAGDGTTTAAQAGEKGVYEINNTIFRIHRLPADFSESTFTLTWGGKGSKVFKIKKIIALADYDLVVPQTVYNRSQGGGKVPFTVQKKDLNGTVELTSASGEPIRAYIKKDNTYKLIDNWNGANATVSYAANDTDTDPIHIILTSNDAVLDDDAFEQSGFYRFKTEPSIIWDEEVIEFTYDGTSTICIKPYSTQKTSFTSAQWEQIKTNGASGNSPGSTAAAIPLWMSFKPASITGLRAGNSIYVECQVSDVFSTGSTPVQVLVYGTITVVNTSTISFTIDSIIFGAAKGSDANVTFANMWQAFADEIGVNGEGKTGVAAEKKGIIPFETGGVKYLGINADLIKTGALSVGDAPTIDETTGKVTMNNNVLYAQMAAGEGGNHLVYLAGWKVTSSSLQSGTPGEPGSFAIFPQGVEAVYPGESHFDFEAVEDVKWVMSAGTSLGITSNGALYCKNIQASGGQLGSWMLTDKIQSSTQLYQVTFETTGGNKYVYAKGMVLRLQGKVVGDSNIYYNRPSIMGVHSSYYELDNPSISTDIFYPFSISADGGVYFERVKETVVGGKAGYNIHYIGNGGGSHPIWNDYLFYVGQKLFDSSADFFNSMKSAYSGRENGIDAKTYLKLDGTGKFGSLLLGEVNPDTTGKVGLYSKNSATSNGFVNYADGPGHIAFWAGSHLPVVNADGKVIAGQSAGAATPWEIYKEYPDFWDKCVPFYVQNNGKVICQELVALGGEFKGTISGGSGSKCSWEFNENGITIEAPNSEGTKSEVVFSANREGVKTSRLFAETVNCNSYQCSGATIFSIGRDGTTDITGLFRVYRQRIGSTEYLTYNTSDPLKFDVNITMVAHYYYKDAFEYTQTETFEYTLDAGTTSQVSHGVPRTKTFTAFMAQREFSLVSVEIKATQNGKEILDELEIAGDHYPNNTEIYTENVMCTTQGVITISCGASLVPSSDAKVNNGGYIGLSLGSDAKHWAQVFAKNSSIQTSDAKVKRDVILFDDRYETLYELLRPVTFRFIEGMGDRRHNGFIAQEVKWALEQSGIDTYDFSAYCEWESEEGQSSCGLRYGEFIPLNTWQIQKTKARVATIEEKLLACEAKISSLEQEIENLKNK